MNTAIGALIAIALAATGVVRGTWAVGGSDSSCYGVMARAFSEGHLQPTSRLANAPWPNVTVTLAPGGFIPSALRPDAAAPICAPGMSVLMAPFAAILGPDGIFWLTPLAAALLVFSAFVIGNQLAGSAAGATAAILTATSPIVLYQTVQPMNDILTASLWLAAIAFARTGLVSGVSIGLAILVRPNLAPLALAVAAIPFIVEDDRKRAARKLALMVAGSIPGALAMLWLNHALYGSAGSSGYGDLAALFSLDHVRINATNHARAVLRTESLVPLLGLAAPLVFDRARRKLSLALLAAVVLVLAIYLPYSPFEEWWYLRFLMPALILMLILSSATMVELLARGGMRGVIPIAAVIVGILGVRTAVKLQAFELQRMEGRYRSSAMLVRDKLPANAVLITVWQSGSMRFHAGREIVMWDSLDPAWLDRGLTWLRSEGYQPYLLFERREEPGFRGRFRGQSDVGALDWPPRFDLNRQVRIYDPADRARFLAGEAYPTENVR